MTPEAVSVLTNFVNGSFQAPRHGRTLPSLSPTSGQVLHQIPDSTAEDVNEAVHAAVQAFPKWSSTTKHHRSRLLLRIADLVEDRLEDFARAESLDNGKPLWLSRSIDIPRVVHNFRFFATAILHDKSECSDLDGLALSYVIEEPVGVAALISPWNLPLYLLTWKIAPCLACMYILLSLSNCTLILIFINIK